MNYLALATSIGAVVALFLHAYGKNHPWAEDVADEIDKTKDGLKK